MAETTAHPELIGRDVASIARERRCSEIDVVCDLSLADDLATRFLVTLSNYDDGPVVDLMTQPGAVFGQSDAGAHVGAAVRRQHAHRPARALGARPAT